MPQEDFVEGWQALVGEPPAIMLDDRHDMISILVTSQSVAPAYEAPPSQTDMLLSASPAPPGPLSLPGRLRIR